MSVSLATLPGPRDLHRWTVALLIVLALHAGAIAWLVARQADEAPAVPPALFIELAPAPETPPAEAAAQPAPPQPEPAPSAAEPPPPQAEAQPPVPEPMPEPATAEPVPQLATPAVPEAEIALPPPPPKPVEKRRAPPAPHPRPHPRAEAKPAPEPDAAAPPALSAPVRSAPSAPSPAAAQAAASSWQSQLLAHLNRFKRYPAQAQMRREQGGAYLRVVLNRAGAVLRFAIERGSGHELLDQEALALIQRAQPLPAPPPEIARETIELVVPLQFHLR